MRFKDQVVIVTGAAHGIGFATVGLVAAEGAAVVAVDRSAPDLLALAQAGHPRVAVVQADCLAEAEVQRAVGQAVA